MAAAILLAVGAASAGEPIIDMHLHTLGAAANGPPPTGICAGASDLPTAETGAAWTGGFAAWLKKPPCAAPIWGPKSDEEVMEQTLAVLTRRNIFGVTERPARAPRALEGGGRRAHRRIGRRPDS